MDGGPTVMTVQGPIAASQCGFTLTHEHPFCLLRQAHHRYDFPDQIDDPDLVAAEVGAIHAIGPVAPYQLTIIEDEGADMTRVAVGHCETMPYLGYLSDLLARGVYIVFDNCGQYRNLGQFEDDIVDLIRRLLDAGHEKRILLSHDVCKFPQFKRHGGPGFTYIAETFLPKLRAAGVPEA